MNSKNKSTNMFKVNLIPLFWLLFISINSFSQNLTISSSGEIGTSGTNWSTSGANPKTITISGDASINGSVFEEHLNLGLSIVVVATDIVLNDEINKTSGNESSITFKASRRIIFNSLSKILSSQDNLNIILWSDADNNEEGGIYIEKSTINTNGGDFTAGGGSDPSIDFAVGYGYPGINIAPIYQYHPQRYGFRMDGGSISAQGGDINIRGTTVSGETGDGVKIGYSNFPATISTNSLGEVYIESDCTGSSAYNGLVVENNSSIDGGSIWLKGKSSKSFALNIGASFIGSTYAKTIKLETIWSGTNGWASSMWLGSTSGDAIIGNLSNTTSVDLIPTKTTGGGRGMISGYGFQLNGYGAAELKIYPGDSNTKDVLIGAGQTPSSSYWDLVDYTGPPFLKLSTELNNNLTGFNQITIGRIDQNVDANIKNFGSISTPLKILYYYGATITNTSAYPLSASLNSAPSNISLTSTSVNENVATGTTIGALSTTDSDSGDTHTYTLVSGSGDTDNTSFSISGANLLTNTALDYETKNSYSILVQTTDAAGATYTKTFTISITDVDEDSDGDGITNNLDNCPSTANADQLDTDADGVGDVCDNAPNTPNADQTDTDGDGIGDVEDAFPLDATEWLDTDADGIGDNADMDDDEDGQLDTDEIACGSDPLLASSMSLDTDGDTIPDCVDTDDDNDGVIDTADAFPLDPAEWADTDADGIGNNADTR